MNYCGPELARRCGDGGGIQSTCGVKTREDPIVVIEQEVPGLGWREETE